LEENEGHKAAKDETLSMCGETMTFFPVLRDWVLTYFHAEHSMVATKDKAHDHEFMVTILKLVQSLVLFGYYTNTNDIIQLVKALLSLLNGATDRNLEKVDEKDEDLKQWRASGRFRNTPANKSVFAVKYEALVVIDILFNFKLNELLNQFLLDFKNLMPHVEAFKAKRETPQHLPASLIILIILFVPFVSGSRNRAHVRPPLSPGPRHRKCLCRVAGLCSVC